MDLEAIAAVRRLGYMTAGIDADAKQANQHEDDDDGDDGMTMKRVVTMMMLVMKALMRLVMMLVARASFRSMSSASMYLTTCLQVCHHAEHPAV